MQFSQPTKPKCNNILVWLYKKMLSLFILLCWIFPVVMLLTDSSWLMLVCLHSNRSIILIPIFQILSNIGRSRNDIDISYILTLTGSQERSSVQAFIFSVVQKIGCIIHRIHTIISLPFIKEHWFLHSTANASNATHDVVKKKRNGET